MTAATTGRLAHGARRAGRAALVLASAAASGMLIGAALQKVAGNRMAPWIIGRAAGVCAYLLLVLLVLLGLALSHPWRSQVRTPSATSRIRAHVALSVFTLGFTVLHVVVLATDRYAGVGWWGAFVPMGASYRPAAVTLGVVGVDVALLVGVSAAVAGRLPRRLWWPLHKGAALTLVLIWTHGVLAGGDTPALLGLYLVTGLLVLVVAISRYAARTPAEAVETVE
jgi:hypothetical protein